MFLLQHLLCFVLLTGTPQIDFAKQEQSFGKIREGRIVNVQYKFTNSGTVPLLIKEVQSSCGCTAVAYPTYPVGPNETDFITVKFISLGKNGLQDKEIRVISNATKKPVVLRLKGEVVAR